MNERQPIEVPFSGQPRNEEWQKFSGTEYRYPNQFGEALLVPGVNIMEEEVAQLMERGAIFPLETAEPCRATFVTEVDAWKPVSEKVIFEPRIVESKPIGY